MSLHLGIILIGIVIIILSFVFNKFFPGIPPKTIRILFIIGAVLIVLGFVLPKTEPLWGKYINPTQSNANTNSNISPDSNESSPKRLSIRIRQNRVFVNNRDYVDIDAFERYINKTCSGNCSFILIDDYAAAKTYSDVKTILDNPPKFSIEDEIPIERANDKE